MNTSSTSLAPDSPFFNPDEGYDETNITEAEVEPLEVHDDAELRPIPHAPSLRPTVPGLSSTVSSLSGSRGVSTNVNLALTTPDLTGNHGMTSEASTSSSHLSTPNNHTLMQMLNWVGNRYLEAEGNGMLPLLEDEEPSQARKNVDQMSRTTGSLKDDERIRSKNARRVLFGSHIDDEGEYDRIPCGDFSLGRLIRCIFVF
jgi:hypothetical protein